MTAPIKDTATTVAIAAKAKSLLKDIYVCLERIHDLTEWEVDFLHSIQTRLGKGWVLSTKQEAALEKIRHKVEELNDGEELPVRRYP